MPSVLANLNELTAIAVNDYLHVLDTSDVTDPDKKIRQDNLLLAYPTRSGTPIAGRVASWITPTTIGDGGFALSDIARLSVSNTYTATQTNFRPATQGGCLILSRPQNAYTARTILLTGVMQAVWGFIQVINLAALMTTATLSLTALPSSQNVVVGSTTYTFDLAADGTLGVLRVGGSVAITLNGILFYN